MTKEVGKLFSTRVLIRFFFVIEGSSERFDLKNDFKEGTYEKSVHVKPVLWNPSCHSYRLPD